MALGLAAWALVRLRMTLRRPALASLLVLLLVAAALGQLYTHANARAMRFDVGSSSTAGATRSVHVLGAAALATFVCAGLLVLIVGLRPRRV
jgi:hypothetical protein